MSSEREAFFAVCAEAEPAKSHHVSLYVNVPFYGGPEEGGWWSSDTELVASQEFSTDEAAEAAYDKVVALAEEWSKAAKDDFNRGCAAECEWLEARGLDADYLPEPDGELRYFVVVEDTRGHLVSQGSRYYE